MLRSHTTRKLDRATRLVAPPTRPYSRISSSCKLEQIRLVDYYTTCIYTASHHHRKDISNCSYIYDSTYASYRWETARKTIVISTAFRLYISVHVVSHFMLLVISYDRSVRRVRSIIAVTLHVFHQATLRLITCASIPSFYLEKKFSCEKLPPPLSLL